MKRADEMKSGDFLSDKALDDLRKVISDCGMDEAAFDHNDLNKIGRLLLTVKLTRLKVERRVMQNKENDGIIEHS